MRHTVTFGALATALFALSLGLSEAKSQVTSAAYPTKPIRVIAPSAPGSPPDVIARLLSEPLAAVLGQPVVVENRSGASGTIGLAAVARADPDGYTLGVVTLPSVVAPSLLTKVPYDPAKDLAPVRQLIWSSNVLVVPSSAPYASLAELVTAAKARPGQIQFASGGNGTPAHLSGELFKLGAGLDIQHIPFKGTVPGLAAVIAGQVDLMFATAGVAAAHIKAGKLRALATSAPARIGAFPEVSTMQELGFTDLAVRDWLGIVGPAATPKPLIERIAAAASKVLTRPEVHDRLTAVGYEPVADSDPEAFARLIQSELVRWAKVVREAGIKAD
jgi:tripartite-type tricarboxylate transporter receptor subunit TctC